MWQQLELASKLEYDLRNTLDWSRKWLVDFNAEKAQVVSFDWSHNFGTTDVQIVLVLKKNHLLRWWQGLPLQNWVWTLTLSLLLKLYPWKLEPWFVIGSLFLLRLLFFFINMSYRRCIEYCCHIFSFTASSYFDAYFDILAKLKKRVCTNVGQTLVASLEPLGYSRNVTS